MIWVTPGYPEGRGAEGSVKGTNHQREASQGNLNLLSGATKRPLIVRGCFVFSTDQTVRSTFPGVSGLGGSSASGIVLDDPASSLDHRWAFRIAKRLVEEAKRRQVIIFTHNLSFLWDLVESAKLASAQVPCAVRTVVAHAKQPGHLHNGLPYEGEKAEARMKVLAEMVQRASATYTTNPDGEEYRILHYQFFARLRGTWERVVEEVLFGGVVRRFQNAVKTHSLSAVQVGDLDHQIIYRGMTTASRNIEAHDRADGVLFTLPTPDEMAGELDALNRYYSDLRKVQ
jgi:hypothetical protein